MAGLYDKDDYDSDYLWEAQQREVIKGAETWAREENSWWCRSPEKRKSSKVWDAVLCCRPPKETQSQETLTYSKFQKRQLCFHGVSKVILFMVTT